MGASLALSEVNAPSQFVGESFECAPADDELEQTQWRRIESHLGLNQGVQACEARAQLAQAQTQAPVAAANSEQLDTSLPDSLWTVGGRSHQNGECTPCRYFISRSGCRNGHSCNGCHQPHAGSRKKTA